jgi:hypothetical protein
MGTPILWSSQVVGTPVELSGVDIQRIALNVSDLGNGGDAVFSALDADGTPYWRNMSSLSTGKWLSMGSAFPSTVVGIITTELQFPGEAPFGRVVQKNTIMDAGIVHLVNRFVGSSAVPFTHLQIGTGGRVVVGETIPNPKFDASIPESPTNRQYYPVGMAKPITPDRSNLFTFYEDQVAGRQTVGGIARYAARFELPLDVAINEAGLFAGSHDASPVMLNQATFVDTVQRIRMTKATPTTDTIFFSVTWDIACVRYPFDKGYHELESDL